MNETQKLLRLQTGAIVVLFLMVIALVVYVLIQQQRTHDALCNFHDDLKQRVTATQTYLDEHPGPEPFPGVSRTSIEQSLANQRRTIESLSDLNCS